MKCVFLVDASIIKYMFVWFSFCELIPYYLIILQRTFLFYFSLFSPNVSQFPMSVEIILLSFCFVQREIICRREALKVKMMSEEEVVILQGELDATKQALDHCQTEYSHTRTLLSRKVHSLACHTDSPAVPKEAAETLE